MPNGLKSGYYCLIIAQVGHAIDVIRLTKVSRRSHRAHGAPKCDSTLGEADQPAARLVPALRDPRDVPRCRIGAKHGEQAFARVPASLGDHRDPAVVEVGDRPDEPELERPRTHPPPHADALHPTPHPRGQPDLLAHQCGCRGRGWQCGQKYDERFMNDSRRIGVPHLGHGSPAWP